MVVGDDEDVQIHDHDPRRESGNAEVVVSAHARQTWGKVASFDYSRRVSRISYRWQCGIGYQTAGRVVLVDVKAFPSMLERGI